MAIEELRIQFEEAVKDLLFMSEVDYPFEVLAWPGSAHLPISVDTIGLLTETKVEDFTEECTIDFLFRHAVKEFSWRNQQEIAIAKRYQDLMKLLKRNLSELKVFRFGRIELQVYILGRTSDGDILGLSTKQFET
jgi:hypothetical protein